MLPVLQIRAGNDRDPLRVPVRRVYDVVLSEVEDDGRVAKNAIFGLVDIQRVLFQLDPILGRVDVECSLLVGIAFVLGPEGREDVGRRDLLCAGNEVVCWESESGSEE